MSEISKLITKYIEEFISSCDKDNKDDIMKEFKTKENKKNLDTFLVSNNIKKKKTKIQKDEDLPKKPLTPYFHFVKDKRSEIKDSGVTDTIKITMELSKKWNEIKDKNSTELKKYIEISEQQKKEYALKMDEYNKKHGIVTVEKQKNAFQFFKEENIDKIKSEFPNISKKEIHRKLQAKWKELKLEKCETVKKFLSVAEKQKEKQKQNEKSPPPHIDVIPTQLVVDDSVDEPKISSKKKKTSSKKKPIDIAA